MDINFRKKTISIKGVLLDLSVPKIMGILNLTPDSFYDGGKYSGMEDLLRAVGQMHEEGADIIDIGGYSSRPGAEKVPEAIELKRIIEPVKEIRKTFPEIIISVDTFRAKIAELAINAGADMINDISGGEMDPKMFDLISDSKVPYVLMHMQGIPENMQENPRYENMLMEIIHYFEEKISLLQSRGVTEIIIDPGFGFGKTLDHNYELLARMDQFSILGQPVMAGFSHKSMINKFLNISPADSLNGTTVLNTLALIKGANILRVHEVKPAKEAILLTSQLSNYHPFNPTFGFERK